jgi:hypothetical protein
MTVLQWFLNFVAPAALPVAIAVMIVFLSRIQYSHVLHFRDGHLFFYSFMVLLLTMLDERLRGICFTAGCMTAAFLLGLAGTTGYAIATHYKLNDFAGLDDIGQARIAKVSEWIVGATLLFNVALQGLV